MYAVASVSYILGFYVYILSATVAGCSMLHGMCENENPANNMNKREDVEKSLARLVFLAN